MRRSRITRTSRRTSEPSAPAVAHALASIRALVASLSRSARTVEQRTGVTNAQLFLLRELAVTNDLTINELAARVMTTQSTVSLIVTRLEAQGLVRRTRAVTDARRVHVALTKRGSEIAARAPEPPTEQLIGALNGLSTSELRGLSRSLDGLLAQLHVATPDSPPLFETISGGEMEKRPARKTSLRPGGRSRQ